MGANASNDKVVLVSETDRKYELTKPWSHVEDKDIVRHNSVYLELVGYCMNYGLIFKSINVDADEDKEINQFINTTYKEQYVIWQKEAQKEIFKTIIDNVVDGKQNYYVVGQLFTHIVEYHKQKNEVERESELLSLLKQETLQKSLSEGDAKVWQTQSYQPGDSIVILAKQYMEMDPNKLLQPGFIHKFSEGGNKNLYELALEGIFCYESNIPPNAIVDRTAKLSWKKLAINWWQKIKLPVAIGAASVGAVGAVGLTYKYTTLRQKHKKLQEFIQELKEELEMVRNNINRKLELVKEQSNLRTTELERIKQVLTEAKDINSKAKRIISRLNNQTIDVPTTKAEGRGKGARERGARTKEENSQVKLGLPQISNLAEQFKVIPDLNVNEEVVGKQTEDLIYETLMAARTLLDSQIARMQSYLDEDVAKPAFRALSPPVPLVDEKEGLSDDEDKKPEPAMPPIITNNSEDQDEKPPIFTENNA